MFLLVLWMVFRTVYTVIKVVYNDEIRLVNTMNIHVQVKMVSNLQLNRSLLAKFPACIQRSGSGDPRR